MESKGSFYITLPSNACMDVYPKNTQSSFKINLPKTLYLKHAYEVALAEIHYPVSWRTFANLQAYSFSVQEEFTGTFRVISISIAYYKDVPEFIHAINVALQAYFTTMRFPNDAIKIQCREVEQKIRIQTKPQFSIKFSSEAADVLGIEYKSYNGPYEWGRFPYDISRGFHALYVYCNVVTPQIVGDVYAPLLRSVAIENKRGEHITKSYSDPHYAPINTNEIHSIELNIKDDTGADVPFTTGKVICKLHFRERPL